MWVRRYNKSNELTQCIHLGDNNETKSYYSVEGRDYLKFNKWDNDKFLDYYSATEDIELIEGDVDGTKFFRCVLKNDKKGGINYPVYNKTFSIENGDFLSFNIDKDKLKKWTKIAKKKSCQKRM